MPNYIDVISNCFPESEVYIKDNLDPTVYDNVVWITVQIDQATLDASDCVITPQSFFANEVSFPDAFGQVLAEKFNKTASAKNVWLTYNGQPSDQDPSLIPFNGKIVGATFSNDKNNVNTDLEIYLTPKGSNTSTLVYTWEIRDAKKGYNTMLPQDMAFEAGSKLSVYLRKVNNKTPKNVNVTIYQQVISAEPTEFTEND